MCWLASFLDKEGQDEVDADEEEEHKGEHADNVHIKVVQAQPKREHHSLPRREAEHPVSCLGYTSKVVGGCHIPRQWLGMAA